MEPYTKRLDDANDAMPRHGAGAWWLVAICALGLAACEMASRWGLL